MEAFCAIFDFFQLLIYFLAMFDDWYSINNINEIDSPALVIYKNRVEQNINMAISMVGDVANLRPHVKTHKSPDVTRMMLAAGITKFKCATIPEAEMLAQCGAPDVLLAYQPTGPKIKRLLLLIDQYPATRFACLIDSVDAAQAIAADAESNGLTVDVLLDVNVGMNRTGVLPENVQQLMDTCRSLKCIKVVGLHGYDGHINDVDVATRKQRADEAFGALEVLRQTDGNKDLRIVIGGSPTFPIHAARKDVECSPGTFVFWDQNYSTLFPDQPYVPAALVISRVVSVVNERRFCLDLGHKSIAAENPLDRRVHFLNAEGITPVAQSEEHLVVETAAPHHYKVGDVLYGMPFHVCPTVALYNTAFVVVDGNVTGTWKIEARDRKLLI
jgi:D-threonine aldolase